MKNKIIGKSDVSNSEVSKSFKSAKKSTVILMLAGVIGFLFLSFHLLGNVLSKEKGGLKNNISVLEQEQEQEELLDNGSDNFTDSRDGKTYKTVKLGDQIWMAENLAFLPEISPFGTGISSFESPHYYVYNYEGRSVSEAKMTKNYKTYGVLYNWKAASESCPPGWHLPTDKEWEELFNFISVYVGLDFKSDSWGNPLGNYLISKNEWNGEDLFGFNVLPSGSTSLEGGEIEKIGDHTSFWSSTECNHEEAYRISFHNNDCLLNYCWLKHIGGSVRCVKDK